MSFGPRREGGVLWINPITFQNSGLAAFALTFFALTPPSVAGDLSGAPPRNVSAYLNKLVSAYPTFIATLDEQFLFLKDGQKFALSDHRTDKSFERDFRRQMDCAAPQQGASQSDRDH
jgi:hypothetical protein